MRGFIQSTILQWILYLAVAIIIFLAISKGAGWASGIDLGFGGLT